MSRELFFLLSLFHISLGASIDPPFNLTPCKLSDSTCVRSVARVLYSLTVRGDPEFGVEPSDPLRVDFTRGDLATVQYTLRNSSLVGFKDCDLVNAVISQNKSYMHYEMNCPKITVTANYKVDGHLVGFPIQGTGELWLETGQYIISVDSELKNTIRKDGNTYLSLKNFKYEGELMGKLDVEMENLFDGHKELADPVLNFIRQNGKLALSIVQGPVLTANMKVLLNNFNKFLKTVPVESVLIE